MAVTVTQHKTGSGNANANTQACTVTSTAAGKLIVVGVAGSHATDTVTSVTDNSVGPPTYVQATGARGVDSTNSWTDVWYALSSKAGATTVTVTFSNTNTNEKNVEVWEVSGFTTPVFDLASNISNPATSATPTGASITTTSATGFAVGCCAGTSADITVNPFAGNEFSSGGDISVQSKAGFCSLISTTAAAHQPKWTAATTTIFGSSTAAWKESSGSPYTVTATAGSYALTGSTTTVVAARKLAQSTGAYVVTGSNATVVAARLVALGVGAYAITGSNATLVYTPSGATYSLALITGTYLVMGHQVTLTHATGKIGGDDYITPEGGRMRPRDRMRASRRDQELAVLAALVGALELEEL